MENEHFHPSHADKIITKKLYEKEYDLNLDSALNELGMLSTITSSRIDYLKEQELDYLNEKVTKKCSSNSLSAAPLCVVHMNSDFVTQFSLSKNSESATDSKSSDEPSTTNFVVKRKMSRKNRREIFFSPYRVRRRELRSPMYQSVCCDCKTDCLVEDRASPPIITRQDSGNKSNPSSPVKSQNSLTSLRCSIFRSRSLDDLEISKLSLNESYEITSHGEIDTVSQRISKLHVS